MRARATESENGPTHVQSKYSVHYDEGLKVGYKWYDAENKAVLFPFGHGLSYTTYQLLRTESNFRRQARVTFTVSNTGKRDGVETAQVYATLPDSAQEPPKRLVGWTKVNLKARREPRSESRNRSAVLADLRRSREWLEAGAGTIHVCGRRIVERVAAQAAGDVAVTR